MNISFQIISDIHLETGIYHQLKPKAPYLILAGDIGYPETQIYKDFMKQCSKKFKKIFYTSGNHEYYNKNNKNIKSIQEIEESIKTVCLQFDNIYYLQNSYYDLDDNLRIVGTTLWSDIKIHKDDFNDYSNIYKSDKQLITTIDTINMFNKNKEYLENIIRSSDKNILIITHHLPSYEMILSEYKFSEYISYYASNIEYLFKKPVIGWVCGHSHGFNKKNINDIPCIINAIGYSSEPRKGASLNYTIEL